MNKQDNNSSASGFTLVELLIVIVVIAILAAITIVAYIGFQNRAADAAVISELSQLKQKFELFRVDNGIYPNTTSDVESLGFKANKKVYATLPTTTYNLLWCAWSDTKDQFAVVARSVSGNAYLISDRRGSVVPYSGTWQSSQGTMCSDLGAPDGGIHNLRGYASDDSVTGPWRAWVGGP